MSMPSRLFAAALVTLPASLALAWMPEPPPGYGPPGYGYPGFPPYAYPELGPGRDSRMGPPSGQPGVSAEPTPPQAPTPIQPGAPEAYGAPYGAPYGPPSGSMGERPRAMPGQLRVTREVTEDAYLVRILVGDGKTDEIQVTPLGRSLAISRTADAQTLQEDTFDEGRGYQRSFSYSRGAESRRLGLPPDADLGGMTREVSDGTITLRIPRSARRGWGPGYGPGQPPMPGETPQGTGPSMMPAPAPEAPPAPTSQP